MKLSVDEEAAAAAVARAAVMMKLQLPSLPRSISLLCLALPCLVLPVSFEGFETIKYQ